MCFKGTQHLVLEVNQEKYIIKEKLLVDVICKGCLEERNEKDFLGKDSCYKCQYKKKLEQLDPNSIKLCKGCGCRVLKSNRWRYCSNECQRMAEIQQKKEYWTNHVAKT